MASNNLGAQLGITAVLHTWSQTLLDHYHLHCIVSGGGLSLDSLRWVPSPSQRSSCPRLPHSGPGPFAPHCGWSTLILVRVLPPQRFQRAVAISDSS